MNFYLESIKNNEINEAPEVEVNSEQLSETEETVENFDDCSLNEVQDSKGNEVNVDFLKETGENFDDCEAKMEEENLELAENDYDDFNDCGKEIEGQYVIEVTYSNDGKINEEEVQQELDESQENLEAQKEADQEYQEDLEQTDDDSKVGFSNIDEESVREGVSQKVDDDNISATEAEEIIDDKVAEKTDGADEQNEAIDDEIENRAVEVAEDEGLTAEQTRLSFQERIDCAFEKEEVSFAEINGLRAEHAAELKAKIEEKSATESELKRKFDEVLSKEKDSEEYKKSLREYNALHDQQMMLDKQIVSMEAQQDILDKKSLELRDMQIQKGKEAVAASVVTLAGVGVLQERYDYAYYNEKPDRSEFASIREESCSTIRELFAEKDSIKQAMDAKMDEISEYVIANNMDRYDTSHDFHYQQLTVEYVAMKESYDRVGYSIVKLDESNRSITERLGDEYVSMVELPPSSRITEVNNGTDNPGETNYVIDEAKESEVLSSFTQGNWEQLTIQEQKQAVEKLADYNAEILGVKDKPRIVYYNTEDPCDFGGYSIKQNVIYINEYNIRDAAEMADTISHEYRHKYQHERAEKLETERDLKFKEGFDNYIFAEDDYQGYKEQLVESDARAYAQVVRDKIDLFH